MHKIKLIFCFMMLLMFPLLNTAQIVIAIEGNSDSGPGTYGKSNSGTGVFGQSSSSYGVAGQSSTGFGIWGFSSEASAAFFNGSKNPGYADIVIGSRNTGDHTGDDAIISSDPEASGSDLFLISNDAVIIELDKNGNESGQFEIWNDRSQKVMSVLESGQFEIWNGANSNNRRLVLYSNGNMAIDGLLSEGSDRNQKENIRSIDHEKILGKLREIPVSTWNYLGDNTPHLGPMAQDFYQAFQLGASDKSIAGSDMQGVLLAAAQAQQEIIDKQGEKIIAQENEIAQIKSELMQLKKLLIENSQ